MPADLIYDETAALIRYDQNKSVMVGSFQAIAATNLPRLRTKEVGFACAKTNKDRQECDEISKQIHGPNAIVEPT